MNNEVKNPTSSLSQTLAIQTQIHLPGTVGRLLKQIRDLEKIAPLFVTAPVLTRVTAQNRRLRSTTPAVHRPLLPVERATWRDWRRRLLNRFGGAPRPFVL